MKSSQRGVWVGTRSYDYVTQGSGDGGILLSYMYANCFYRWWGYREDVR